MRTELGCERVGDSAVDGVKREQLDGGLSGDVDEEREGG